MELYLESVFGLVLYSLIHLKEKDLITILPSFTHPHVVAVANLCDFFASDHRICLFLLLYRQIKDCQNTRLVEYL